MTPAFHYTILKSYFEVFNEQSRILSGIFEGLCRSFPGGKGEIDVYPYITRCSLDIICGENIRLTSNVNCRVLNFLNVAIEASMGTRIGAQTQDSDYVRAVYRYLKIVMIEGRVARFHFILTGRIGQLILEKMLRPWLEHPWVFSKSALGREHDQLLGTLHAFTDGVGPLC